MATEIEMSPEDTKLYNQLLEEADYYDRLQYVYKIKLNSLYGGLSNLYFRFFDRRMGESTTSVGRTVLKHQCRMVSKVLEDNYDVEFPLYNTVNDAMEAGFEEEEAKLIALEGPTFKGSFLSDCVIYGDTDSTYFKTYADTNSEAIQIGDAVAQKINQSYPEFMRQTFLCTEGYDDLIKAGREVISDRGIFVEKKRYMLHLIDLDGKTVDKTKIMGLDLKKTTLPGEVSKKLTSFMERFLKGESWEDVSKSIVQYKDELILSKNVMNIGLPKGVNGIDQYTSKYLEEGIKARLPGHVAAAIHYNTALDRFNDKASLRIKSGMKIKVFYLIGDYGKFKSIALPTDLEVIPDWFAEHFVIDRQLHIEKLIDNPLLNIIKAIDKVPPSKQSLFIDDLLVF